VRPRAVVLAWSLLLATRAVAASEPAIPFQEFTLPNGLRVFLSEDHRAPQVTLNVWYHVGAANQAPGKSGFAHLFEHMMFSGSQHVPDPDKVLAAIGAGLGGAANGSTDFDRTNYFETVPASQLPTALWIESDRMGFLLPKPHPYYHCVIGSIEEIQAASLDDIRGFFREFYVPRNATLAIVGDFDPKVARELVTKYFGDLPAGPPAKRPDVPQPRLQGVVEKTIPDPIARIPQLQMVWNGVKPFAPDEAAGDVLATILGGSKTSRLYRRLVEEKQIASSVYAGNSSLGLGGYFQIVATAREGHTVAEIRREVEAVLEDFRKTGPTAAEVERAKRLLVGGMVRSVERIAGKADQLNAYAFWTGDPGFLAKDIARYRAVTAAQVLDASRTQLPVDRLLVLDVEPSSTATPGARP
jgi:predicted Zn-dependent peptidase